MQGGRTNVVETPWSLYARLVAGQGLSTTLHARMRHTTCTTRRYGTRAASHALKRNFAGLIERVGGSS
jgi:hypothetical protein